MRTSLYKFQTIRKAFLGELLQVSVDREIMRLLLMLSVHFRLYDVSKYALHSSDQEWHAFPHNNVFFLHPTNIELSLPFYATMHSFQPPLSKN